jgi:hypothetical protein
MKVRDLDLRELFGDETDEELYKDLASLFKNMEYLEYSIPEKADNRYFAEQETEIMDRINGICDEIQESLIDFCENSIEQEQKTVIENHLEMCPRCTNEYYMTRELIEKSNPAIEFEENRPDYFDELPEAISDKVFSDIKSICEMSQDCIINEYTEDKIPEKIHRHIQSCPECKKAVEETNNIIQALGELATPMPNESYFKGLLNKIDNTIELIPSPTRLANQEREGFIASLGAIYETVKSTLMQPYSAMAITAMVILLVVGGRLYFNEDTVIQRQINLSELLKNTQFAIDTDSGKTYEDQTSGVVNTVPNENTASREIYFKNDISHPSYDESLDLKTSGTAKKKIEKQQKDKILN